jgi:GDP-4-dehydro-6-deoxy-D-mannose reductase
MKSLITGANGFIGNYLSSYLSEVGDAVFGLDLKKSQTRNKNIQQITGNLLEPKFTVKMIEKVSPDRIFHLAAQSNITYSFSNPRETMEINIGGTLNLLESIRKLKKVVTFVSFGSSAEYGKSAKGGEAIPETAKLEPTNPYGVSKVAAGHLVEIYRQAYKLNLFHIRPFSIIGPSKLGDAVSDFARGIVEIERGKKKELLVGNVSHVRDFLDVRDAVCAIEMVSRAGTVYSVYNICSGQGRKLEDILNKLVKLSTAKIKIEADPKKGRPADDPTIVGDPNRLFSVGFKPKISIDKTLSDILTYWRKNFTDV